jgi:predicted N-acetyltransferase YhbS
MIIRAETLADLPAIRSVVTAAFQDAPHSGGSEAAIVDALRKAGALAVSLVAQDEGAVVGHVAFSPVIPPLSFRTAS